MFDHIGMSIQGKLRAVGNFARSFKKRPEVPLLEPKDVVITSGRNDQEKDWTVLVYGDGRNKLALSNNMAINKLEKTGSDENVNIVFQSTLEPVLKERFAPDMERANTRRFYIRKDDDPKKITSPLVGDSGESVPLTPESLSDFLSWGIKNFPAKHYMVVIRKHGLGFAKSGDKAPLSARELNSALEMTEKNTGRSVDVLSFDSCSMQNMEVGYEIKEHAKVMTASQEDIYAIDFPYDKILENLKKDAGTITPQEVGKIVVDSYQAEAPYGMHTAVDLEKLGETTKATKELVNALIEEKVPPEVIYTDMLKSSSMEPQESRHFAFNFRDEEGFLRNIINDKNISSERIKNAAKDLQEKLSDSIISHKIGESKSKIKDAKGFNLFIPWKDPSKELKEGYEKLQFQKDTHWMDLIDYVFTSQGVAMSFADEVASPQQKLSITQKFGKAVIKNYKKYVSPYLAIACKHTPSCSQYGREAIEKHGLVQGGKMAFMRILGCNPESEGRYDPVPEKGEEIRNIDHGPPPPGSKDVELPDILIKPPEKIEKSRFRKAIENIVIRGNTMAGKVLGGAVGAAISLPIGLAMGAVIGTKAGKNSINEELNKPLLEKYHQDSVRQFVKIEKPIGTPGHMTYNAIKNLTGSFEINDSTIDKLQDMSGFEFNDKAIEFLTQKITDKDKAESIKTLRGRKTTKDQLLKGMKQLGFNDKEIDSFLFYSRNEEAAGKLADLKPLEGKKFKRKELENKLSDLKFNKKEIEIILDRADFTCNETLARSVGGAVGAVTGTILGAFGGAAVGYQWGSKFAGLFAGNYTKEKFGELPKHPVTESILQRDYREK